VSVKDALETLYGLTTGGIQVKGTWDATTNTPALASGVGDIGDLYVVIVAGNTSLDGETDWKVGDYALFVPDPVADKWVKVDNTESVVSVNTKTGAVVLDKTDIGLSNVTNDSQLKRAAGDIGSFSEKVSPSNNDVFLIEDSGDSNNKKKLKWSAMASAPGAHAATHEDGGGDEIDVAGLSGELADPQPPKTHASSHEGGADPVTPAGIGAEPSIAPKNTAFNKDFGSGAGTVCEGNDSRLSDDRNDPDAIHDDVSGEIAALSEKVIPVDNDLLIIEDSADSNSKKKLKISNLPSDSGNKTVFFMATDYANTTGDFRSRRIGATGAHEFTFPIPPDFSSLVSCDAIGIYLGSGGSGKQIDLYSDYGALGEDYNQHDESDIGTLFDFTGKSNKIVDVDISSVLSSIAAGDYVGVHIDHKGIGDSIDYIYIKLVYTPS
jgi:hypothetical protein